MSIVEAVKAGDTEQVYRLLREANHKDILKSIALSSAVAHLKFDLVTGLIEEGTPIINFPLNGITSPLGRALTGCQTSNLVLHPDTKPGDYLHMVRLLLPLCNRDDIRASWALNLCTADLDAVRLLLQYGANPNVSDREDNRALHCAAAASAEAIDLLVDAGADVNALGHNNWTPLMALALNEQDCSDAAQRLVEHGGHLGVEGMTDWQYVRGCAEAARNDSDLRCIFIVNEQIRSLFFAACQQKRTISAADLPKHSGGMWEKLFVQDKQTEHDGTDAGLVVTALGVMLSHRAVDEHYGEAEMEYDEENEDFILHDPLPLICKAAQRGDASLVEYLLNHGVDPDTTDADGFTPLAHIARVYCGTKKSDYERHRDCIHALTRHGANIRARLPNGLSMAVHTAISGRLHLSFYFLSNGSDIDARDSDGRNALMLVAMQSPGEVSWGHELTIRQMVRLQQQKIEFLFRWAHSHEAKDASGLTCLDYAARTTAQYPEFAEVEEYLRKIVSPRDLLELPL